MVHPTTFSSSVARVAIYTVTVFVLSVLTACGSSSDSSSSQGLMEISRQSDGYAAKLLDLSSSDVRASLMRLFELSGDTRERSPKFFSRLDEELGTNTTDPNGTSRLDAGILGATRSSLNEVKVETAVETKGSEVVVFVLTYFTRPDGGLLGDPQLQKFFVPDSRIEFETTDSLLSNSDVVANNIFIVEDTDGAFSIYGSSLTLAGTQSAKMAATSPTAAQGSVGGCFAAGTVVTLANGGSMPIETLAVQTQILVANGGAGSAIRAITTGKELRPLRVYFNNATQLTVTKNQPFYTTRGVIKASNLLPGMLVKTQNGTVPVISIQQVAGPIQVYNIALMGNPGSPFYANNFAVGDTGITNSMARAVVPTPVLPRLPGSWNRDYQNTI